MPSRPQTPISSTQPSVTPSATLMFLALCACRRKATRDAEVSATQRKESRDPFADVNRESWAPYIDRLQTEHGLTQSSTMSTSRQLYISNEVHRAREKVAELEEMSLHLRSSSITSSRADRPDSDISDAVGGNESVAELVDAADPELPVVQAQLERANQEIQGLNNWIRELEMQRRSSWALGLSDESPPGYSE
ncbi:hypothetical protein K438DRAFT_1780946 [Mycena galopus ATCC 62051]|nr:hypothetical protein K438DRAFT_1780946 [Mycena galopus ATCC 62051]